MSRAPRAAADPRTILREVTAGATVAVIALPFCVSAGVLAYEPLGREYIGLGAAAGILCAVMGGLTGALARNSTFIPNVPSAAMALIQASFAASMLDAFAGNVAATLAVMPLSVLAAGLWQALFAATGLGRTVKFTPYPVVAGFVTGLAVLTFLQQAPRLFDAASMAALVEQAASLHAPPIVMPILGIGLIALIRLSERLAPRLPAMLVGLVAGTAGWHLLHGLAPGLELGRTIGAVSVLQASLGLHLDLDMVLRVMSGASAIQSLLLTSLTLAVLGTLDLTFALRAAQNLSDVKVGLTRDLAAQGLSNVVSSMSGSLAVTTSIAFSISNFESGGRGRISTVAVALTLLAMAVVVPALIAALPIVVLAAILISIAWRMWDRWCVAVIRDMLVAKDRGARVRARRNAAIVATVATATVLGQPVVGALVGTVLACVVFIMEMSRPIVRRRLDGGQSSSKRVRTQADRAILAARRRQIAIFDLQGVLFFGNADDLASEIRSLEEDAEILILDLRRVTDLDTSGASVVQQIARRCSEKRVRLMIAAAEETYHDLLRDALAEEPDVAIFRDLDSALERAEDLTLAAHEPCSTGWGTLRIDETDLAGGLSESELAALERRMRPCAYAPGEALCRAGEPADKLWLITRGSVSVRMGDAGHARRIACLGPGTSVGEMGLLDRRPRSADVVADCEVQGYVLASDDFDAMLRDEPHLGQSLLATIARLTAQRLRATSEELRLADV